jgi:hypothetical protein
MKRTMQSLPLIACLALLAAPFGGRASVQEGEGQEDPQEAPEEARPEEGVEADGQRAKASEPQPEFKNDKAKAEFAAGKERFSEGKYKEAKKAFDEAARGAKSKEDRERVQLWSKGSFAAMALEKVRLLVKNNQLHQAYQQMASLEQVSAGTPAKELCDALRMEIEGKLFTVLETFDYRSPKYTEKFGKFFINDPKLVARGAGCLRWVRIDKNSTMLQIKGVPTDWRGYEAIEFWLCITTPPVLEAVILTTGDPKAKLKVGSESIPPSFMTKVDVPSRTGQWQLVRLKLSDFKVQGGGSLESVLDFRLQAPANRAFDLLIDDIRLMRKDPSAKAPERRG